MTNIIKQQVKKVALAVILVVAFWGVADAQTNEVTGNDLLAEKQVSGPVKLNVVLHPFRTLTVNHSDISLVYQTPEHYKAGVKHRADKHLSVTNIGGGYKIYVKAESTDLINDERNTIEGSGVTIKGIAAGQEAAVNTRSVSDASISTGVELFKITKNTAGIQHDFDVEYEAAGNNAYTNKISENKPTTYTVNITYTILSE